jgi:hypothetical protein
MLIIEPGEPRFKVRVPAAWIAVSRRETVRPLVTFGVRQRRNRDRF